MIGKTEVAVLCPGEKVARVVLDGEVKRDSGAP
jgi:hypothetical protein